MVITKTKKSFEIFKLEANAEVIKNKEDLYGENTKE
jgi:hypothetical protein